ncbi:hypothetical protein M9H61_11285 [Thalassospira sp. GO-4]|jgi:hypothetical protein|uniref:hypothetical protein n=1 Tax=Thalassospira sp. GO-4 TaxID=2946605 RepID=UPI0020242F58|nr:hypothetical protein [Thalassospira sp. GO-4]URK16133.1 hypothetical protein M9H61_11285 [Thalassospira sp. GO-4]
MMMKPHLAKTSICTAFLATAMTAGSGLFSAVFAQSTDSTQVPASSRLTFGTDLGAGILPPAGSNGIGRYFSSRPQNSIVIGPALQDAQYPENASQFWLEIDSNRNTRTNALSAQIGLGYAPVPELGIAVGPFVELGSTRSENIGNYQTGGYAPDQRRSQVLFSDSDNAFHDAGLAASLSYMPLEDIWIGLHGSVSRNMAPPHPEQSILDGIDAMLGLTASYRIEF